MKIQWLGHSCFLLTAQDGTRVLTDPFNPEIGYPAPAVEADIVTTSHQHVDHNYTKVVKGKFTVVNSPGSHVIKGIEILGVPTFHDEAKGAKRGKNLIFRIILDGISVIHCGDLGHQLSAEQVKALGTVDVLLLPVGGYYNIDHKEAKMVMDALHPRLTVPMHFKTPAINFPIQPAEPFLALVGGGNRAGAMDIEVDHASLAQGPQVLVLDYPK